ncbi:Uncharacterised protein [Mycobacteroides abscessus subsp. abscessus]|nr:Uncharacterised protein [Mycobacteroides abscessus subsp. abscessus]
MASTTVSRSGTTTSATAPPRPIVASYTDAAHKMPRPVMMMASECWSHMLWVCETASGSGGNAAAAVSAGSTAARASGAQRRNVSAYRSLIAASASIVRDSASPRSGHIRATPPTRR